MSKQTHYFTGRIKNGILKLYYKREWLAFLKSVEGKEIELYASPLTGHRTLKQNSLFFAAICQKAAAHQGNAKEWWHRFFEEKFLGKEWQTFGKERVLIQKTCSLLDKNDFSAFIEECKLWLIENMDFQFNDPSLSNL